MDIKNLVRNKVNKSEEKRTDVAREVLEKEITRRLRTVMIGAISSLENNFGFLFAFNENRERTDEEMECLDIFNKTRSEILDRGNAQIRAVQDALDLYDISLAKKSISLPMAKI